MSMLKTRSDLFGAPLVPPVQTIKKAESIIMAAADQLQHKPKNQSSWGTVFQDYRRDDFPEDSNLWMALFIEADKVEPRLYDALLGFRCIGARLLPTTEGSYVIRPVIDSSGDTGFKSQEEYDQEKAKWLRPYFSEIVTLLKNLRMAKDKIIFAS